MELPCVQWLLRQKIRLGRYVVRNVNGLKSLGVRMGMYFFSGLGDSSEIFLFLFSPPVSEGLNFRFAEIVI